MKKFISLLMLSVLGIFVISCTTDTRDKTDNDTYSVMYDITGNFQKNNVGIYTIFKTYNKAIPSTDVVLVYRLSEIKNGTKIWQQIPRTLYLTQGELDYDFDFTVNDIELKAGGNYDISTTPTFLNNQTFRIVFVPASAGKVKVDYSNYNEVIRFYNIDESKVKNL